MESKINIKVILRRYGVLIALVLALIIFSFLEPTFFSLKNFLSIIRQSSITGILAIGLTTVVISGEFDMSFGAVASFAGCLSIVLMGELGWGAVPAWIIAILASLAIGAINGGIIVYLGVPSIIETIGMMSLLAGVTMGLTNGSIYYSLNPPDLLSILGRASSLGVIPNPVIIFAIIIFVFIIILEHTKIGRYFHAVGGNPEASRHVGIKIKRVKFTALIISALMAGLGGIMLSSLLGAGSPSMGEGYLIPAISAMFVGAVFLTDGTPNVIGTVIGAILLSVLANGFVMANVSFYLKEVIMGLVLIGAVSMIAAFKKGEIPGVKLF